MQVTHQRLWSWTPRGEQCQWTDAGFPIDG